VREIVAAKQAVLEAQLRRRAARQEAELAKQLAGEGSARLIAPLAAMKGPSREGSYRGSPLGDRAEAGRAQERARRCSLDDDVLAAGVATSGGLVPGAGACGGSPLSAMSAGPTETKLWRLSDVEGGGGGGAGAGKGLPRVNTTGGGGESSSSPAGARGDMDAFKSREGSFLSTDGSRSPRGDGSHGGSHTKPRSHRSASFQETRIEPLGDKGHDRVKRLSADELGSLPSGSPAYSSGGGSSFGRERRYGSPAPGGSAPRRRNSIDDGDDDFDGGGQRSHGGSFMSERGSSFGGGFRRHSQESFQQGRIAGRVSGARASHPPRTLARSLPPHAHSSTLRRRRCRRRQLLRPLPQEETVELAAEARSDRRLRPPEPRHHQRRRRRPRRRRRGPRRHRAGLTT